MSGSTVNADNTMPGKAEDTVAYDSKVNTAVKLEDMPGLVPIASGPGTGANSGIEDFTPVAGSGSGGGEEKSVARRTSGGGAVLGVVMVFGWTLAWM